MFNLSQKIEEIRQKPEHIRMRYVWAWLAISMVFVFMIWIFSVKENFSAVDFDESGFSNLRNDLPSVGENDLLEEGAVIQKESISALENDVNQK